MGRVARRLTGCKIVGLDTPVFLYHLENNPGYSDLTQELLDGIERGRWEGITSAITLMEVTVHPWQLEREEVARKYEALLVSFPHLSIAPIDREAARLAAQLRARFGLRPPDALQAAAVLTRGAQAFVTNDKRLKRLDPLIKVIVLEDLL